MSLGISTTPTSFQLGKITLPHQLSAASDTAGTVIAEELGIKPDEGIDLPKALGRLTAGGKLDRVIHALRRLKSPHAQHANAGPQTQSLRFEDVVVDPSNRFVWVTVANRQGGSFVMGRFGGGINVKLQIEGRDALSLGSVDRSRNPSGKLAVATTEQWKKGVIVSLCGEQPRIVKVQDGSKAREVTKLVECHELPGIGTFHRCFLDGRERPVVVRNLETEAIILKVAEYEELWWRRSNLHPKVDEGWTAGDFWPVRSKSGNVCAWVGASECGNAIRITDLARGTSEDIYYVQFGQVLSFNFCRSAASPNWCPAYVDYVGQTIYGSYRSQALFNPDNPPVKADNLKPHCDDFPWPHAAIRPYVLWSNSDASLTLISCLDRNRNDKQVIVVNALTSTQSFLTFPTGANVLSSKMLAGTKPGHYLLVVTLDDGEVVGFHLHPELKSPEDLKPMFQLRAEDCAAASFIEPRVFVVGATSDSHMILGGKGKYTPISASVIVSGQNANLTKLKDSGGTEIALDAWASSEDGRHVLLSGYEQGKNRGRLVFDALTGITPIPKFQDHVIRKIVPIGNIHFALSTGAFYRLD